MFGTEDIRKGKGGKKLRLGPKHTLKPKLKSIQQTPNQIALKKLSEILNEYPWKRENRTEELVRDEASRLSQLRYMNMKVLAATLFFLNDIEFDLIPENFTDSRLEIPLSKLMPTVTELKEAKIGMEEAEAIRIKFKASILRYAFAITASK